MEENILFGELNNIKNEIVNDLNILEKLENDIKLRVVCENNKQLSDQVRKLNSEYNERINELKNENLNFKDEHIRLNKIYGDKDGELLKVKKNMRNVIEDNKCLQDSLNSIKCKCLYLIYLQISIFIK